MAPDSQSVTLQDFLHRPERHQRAASRGAGIDASVIQRWSKYSRNLCVGCVRREYLESALADRELQGRWGWTTEAERREIRLQRVAVASRITEPWRVSSLFRWVTWEAL
jgi:hypothetical protein